MIGTKDMIVYNLIRLFIVLVLVCYVKPMDEGKFRSPKIW